MEHFKPYCGADKIPKGHRKGTMQECAEKKQIRLYGINKINLKTLELIKKKTEIPDTRENLIKLVASLRGKIRTVKVRATTVKDPTLAAMYLDDFEQADKKLKTALTKLIKIEKGREMNKAKTKTKDKTKAKTKVSKSEVEKYLKEMMKYSQNRDKDIAKGKAYLKKLNEHGKCNKYSGKCKFKK